MYKGLVPFSVHNNCSMSTYVWKGAPDKPGLSDDGNILWKENQPFEDTLKLVSYQTGRSAVNFIWESETTKAQYYTSLAEGFCMIPDLKEMKYTGKFIIVKRGQNYLLERYCNAENDS